MGHLANICHIDNVPRDYMNLNISLAEARVEAFWIRTAGSKRGVCANPVLFRKFQIDCVKLLAYIACKERQQKQLEKQARQPPP